MTRAEDKHNFITLITEHQNIIHKICNVYCYNVDDKQDLYQEITLQLWKSYPDFQHKSSFSTWMYRVALNTAITMTKKMKVFEKLSDNQQLFVLQQSEPNLELEEDVRILYRAINELNKVEKAIVLLWLEEKSYEEIADITGITIKNVSVKLVRVKKKLAQIITKLQ